MVEYAINLIPQKVDSNWVKAYYFVHTCYYACFLTIDKSIF